MNCKENKQIKKLFGCIPELDVKENDKIIDRIPVNANLSVGYLEDQFFESEGLTKLKNGKLVFIEHVAGMIDATVITPAEAVLLIQKNQAYYLIPKLGLESEFSEQQEISESLNPRVYEVEVCYAESI